jgi:hypothetical protein
MRCEMRVLLNEKMEPSFIDWHQSARGLRHSVGSTRAGINQCHLADQRTCPCGLDYVVAKPHVHLPFQYHVHLVTLVAFTEKDIARRELHRVSFLTKKFCWIHKWRLVDKPSV